MVIGETNGLKAAQLDKGPPDWTKVLQLDQEGPKAGPRSSSRATVLQLNQGAPTDQGPPAS